jgi:hypothetical protein
MKMDVPEHARVMNMAYSLMLGRTKPRTLIKTLVMRDLGDIQVLKRVRLIQLQMLADASRVSAVYPTKMKTTDRDLGEDDSEGTIMADEVQPGKISTVKHQGSRPTLGGNDDVNEKSD